MEENTQIVYAHPDEVAELAKAKPKLRILCFHGFYNNIEVIEHQIGYFKFIFGEYFDFVAINGPHEIEKVYDQVIRDKFAPPFFGWFNRETRECRGASESIKYIVEYMNEHGPFHGVFAFSQGTIMARIMLKFDELE
mmetsp:Transcript_543/g.565  ORF Transcript_543/g.565 Transcript_543/m.565 type:complete len:137 (-) Transcript_543:408-818(-)